MAFNSGIVTSIFGRRLGLQTLSSSQSGGTRTPAPEYLVGPDSFRQSVTTGETTSSNLYPSGVSYLTTAQSSGVYTIDPPVPGVEKTLIFATTGTNPIYLRTSTDASITIATSQGTTMCVISSSQAEFTAIKLIGATTASWVAANSVSSGYLRMSTST
jgi:hypothetical protein